MKFSKEIRTLLVILLCPFFFTGCGLFGDDNETVCEPTRQSNLTGDISKDIIGTWDNCRQTIDSMKPLCVFEPDGILRLVYAIPSKELSESDPAYYQEAGTQVMYTYQIKSNKVIISDGRDVDVIVNSITESTLINSAGSDVYGRTWERTSCEGYGFD